MMNHIRENVENLTHRASRTGMNFQTFTEHLLDPRNGMFRLSAFVPYGARTYEAGYYDRAGNFLDVIWWERETGELVLKSLEIFEAKS